VSDEGLPWSATGGRDVRDDILAAMEKIRDDTSWPVHQHLISPEEARAGRGHCIECGALVERKPQ